MKWEVKSSKKIHAAKVFDLEEISFSHNNKDLTYTRLRCPNWVNVLPVTTDNKAVLIRQYRAGVLDYTLELPGGIIDPGENDTTMAALRELEEETGYTSTRILPLAALNANPAIMDNKVHMFVALACQLNPDRQHFPDADEDIEIQLVDIAELDQLIRTGRIDHALCGLTVMLAQKYLKV